MGGGRGADPLTAAQLKKVRAALEAGIDPNVGLILFASDARAAADARRVVSAATSLDDAFGLRLDGAVPQWSLVCEAMARADKGLLDTIKAHSKVPLDPKAVSMAIVNRSLQFGCPLLMAIRGEHRVQAVRMALELGCDANTLVPHHNGYSWNLSPLAIFASMVIGNVEQAEALYRMLVKAGADLNALDSGGVALLHVLVTFVISRPQPQSQAVLQLVKVALELGADPNLIAAAPSPMIIPVHGAVTACFTQAQHEATPSQATTEKVNACLRLLQVLQAAGAELRPEASTLQAPAPVGGNNAAQNYLHEAVLFDSVQIVQWVLKHKKHTDRRELPPGQDVPHVPVRGGLARRGQLRQAAAGGGR